MRATGKLVAYAQCGLDILQVLNVHARGERRLATDARSWLSPRSLFLVKLDTDLRRSLEYVKELSKRKVQKSEDDRYRVQHGEKSVIQAMQQMRGCGEEETGDGNGEKHQQRHH